MALGLVLPLLPVVAANAWRSGSPAFLSSNGPYIFFLGNVHDAAGTSAGPSLQARKLAAFFGPEEVPNNLSYAMARKTNPRLALAPVQLYLLLPAALFGLALTLRRRQRYALLHLFLLTYTASTVAFYVLARLRQPVVPVLLLLAGVALEWMWRTLAERRWLAAGLAVAVVAAATLWLKPPPPVYRPTDYAMAAAAYFSLGEEHEHTGHGPAARRAYARALALNPDHDRALGHIARLDTRRPPPSELPPPEVAALCEEARASLQAGRSDDAQRQLERAVRLAPAAALPWHYLANVHYLRGDARRAMECLERAVELAPRSRLYRENLRRLRAGG